MVMDTDRFNDAQDETLIKRRPWYVLATALLVLSVITRQPIAFLAAVFALVIGIVPELWYRYALRDLVIRQRVNQKRAFFGETVILSISVENQKLLPLPWLETQKGLAALMETPQGLTRLGSVTSANPGTSDTRLCCM